MGEKRTSCGLARSFFHPSPAALCLSSCIHHRAMMIRGWLFLAAVLCLMVGTDAAVFDVSISDSTGALGFTPNTLNIASGDTVTWTCENNVNLAQPSTQHTVTPENPLASCQTDTGAISPVPYGFTEFVCQAQGQQFNFTFPSAGRLNFYCRVLGHCPAMRGVIIVDNAPATQQPTPTPTVSNTPSPSSVPCVRQDNPSGKCKEIRDWLKPADSLEADEIFGDLRSLVCKHCKARIGSPFICGYIAGLWGRCNGRGVVPSGVNVTQAPVNGTSSTTGNSNTDDVMFACQGECDALNAVAPDPRQICEFPANTSLGSVPFLRCSLMGGRSNCRACGVEDNEQCPFTHARTSDGGDLCKSTPVLEQKQGPFPNWVFIFLGGLCCIICCLCICIIILIFIPKDKLNPCKWFEWCPKYLDM